MEYICSVLSCSCKGTAGICSSGAYGDASIPGGTHSWNMDKDKYLSHYLTTSVSHFSLFVFLPAESKNIPSLAQILL